MQRRTCDANEVTTMISLFRFVPLCSASFKGQLNYKANTDRIQINYRATQGGGYSIRMQKGFSRLMDGQVFLSEEIQLQVEGCKFQVSGCKFQVAGCRLQVASFRFQVAGFRFQVARYRLQVARFRFQVKSRLPINDYRLPITDYRPTDFCSHLLEPLALKGELLARYDNAPISD